MGLLDLLLGRPKKITNPKLDDALQALAQSDTPERRKTYYQRLAGATFIVPSPGLEGKGLPMNQTVTTDASVNVNLIAVDAPDGGKAIVAFTSEPALLAWRQVGCPSLGIGAQVLAQMVLHNEGASLIVNPCGPSGGFVTRDELGYFAERRLPPVGADADSVATADIEVRAPSSALPPTFVDAVRTVCAAQPAVRLALVAEMVVKGGQPRLLVGIALDDVGSPAGIIPRMLEAIGTKAGIGGLEGVHLDGSRIAEQVRATGPATYERP